MRDLTSVDISYIQLIAFPVLLYVFYRFSFFGLKVPARLLIAALFCAVFTTAFSFTYLPARGGVFLVARLSDDDHEINSRRFRSAISDDISRLGHAHRPAVVRRYFREISTVQEAFEVLAGGKDRRALVWGNLRWLNISLQKRDPRSLGELGVPGVFEWFHGLRIVLAVPVTGLSFHPQTDTAEFLAKLFSGLAGGSPGTVLTQSQELYLRDAGQTAAPWSSFAHRAYPYLLTGNHHFLQALSSEEYQAGEMRCAIEAYFRALSFLRPKDNSDLQAALHNNLGAAFVVRTALESRRRFNKLPVKHFALARRAGLKLNRFHETPQGTIEAGRNIETVRGLWKKKSLKASKKKARKKEGKKAKRKRSGE